MEVVYSPDWNQKKLSTLFDSFWHIAGAQEITASQTPFQAEANLPYLLLLFRQSELKIQQALHPNRE
jgi:hypothetical protein